MQTLNNHINKDSIFIAINKNTFFKYLKNICKYILLIAVTILFLKAVPIIKSNYLILRNIIATEFFIKEVAIIGDTHLGNTQIINILNINKQTSLYNFNAKEARNKLILLPWVNSVEVEKKYPSKLEIFIKERKPYAVYSHNNNFDLIDDKGIFMGEVNSNLNLPVVEGVPNAYEAFNFLQNLRKIPFLFSKLKSSVCFANNRWNIILKDNICIKLSSEQTFENLNKLIEHGVLQKLLKTNVKTIDLRNIEAIAVILNKPDKTIAGAQNVL